MKNKMGLIAEDGFGAFSNCCVAHTSAGKRFTGVVSNCVVDNHESSWNPLIGTGVCGHKIGEVSEHVIRKKGIISKDNSGLRVVSLVDPASVGCDDLVEKGFVAI